MKSPKTLVFCTAYAHSLRGWNVRYRQWLDAVRVSSLRHDQLLLIDDGSPALPTWTDIKIVSSLHDDVNEASAVLHHFQCRLGNDAGPWPGWNRSFLYAARYAKQHGFERIVHLESDAFLISDRLCRNLNEIEDEWVTLWCPRHSMPESGIQVMAGSGLQMFFDFASKPYSERIGKTAELGFPRTRVEKGFVGDRYGEYLDHIPRNADYVMQANADRFSAPDYLWWIPESARLKYPIREQ